MNQKGRTRQEWWNLDQTICAVCERQTRTTAPSCPSSTLASSTLAGLGFQDFGPRAGLGREGSGSNKQAGGASGGDTAKGYNLID